MSKRLVAAAAVALLAVTAAGCGGGGSKSSSSAATTTSAATGGKQLKVGLSLDIGQLNDRGFNHLSYTGLTRAEKQLGIQGRIHEAASGQDYIPNMTSFARQGYDLIIAVGFDQENAVAVVAKKFPKTDFAIVDVDWNTLPGKPKNVRGLLFREQQVGYLAGYLAGLVAKQGIGTGAPASTVSTVGGQKQPPVDRFIAGYQAGAKKADPGVKLLNAYSQDWVAQDKCKELALNQIAAGSKVVFQVAGGCGLGVLDAAKEKGVWGIGVDADQSYLGPQVLTSATKGVDEAVFQTIRDAVQGRFHGGNEVYGLDRRGVGLGKISPKVPRSVVAKVNAIRQQIIAGKIADIPTSVK
ncbi:MAG TPA: BMP family ABC transporter substrate-binding protein [Gaiellaceae bacterium]